jgi:hypothetical protein
VPQLKVYSTPLPPNESNWILLSDLLRSDHASFLYNGYPAVMLTDGSEFRNPHYHLASDTMGTLNYRFAANVTKATVGAIAELAGLQHSSTAESEAFKLDAPTTTERPASMPSRQAAFRLYPNPTGGRLTLAADLPQGQRLRVALYDHHGRHLGQLLDRRVAAGAQHWQLALPDAVGHRLSSGLYIVRIHGEHTSRSLRLMLR